ncbi:hypothetical protein GCM10022251_79940 [Phytohabitans flavus]|uniref:Uncharacterized protein n=1 Tax=Phytohabitans flavus TaxID=1076124 RepID=A0A6F8XIQ1_9ACTN|nr:hypothetical protein [Phytohabitans flavus]BCB73696.1 hypothetical protein Pflav_001060 [Phytohabitans flavus]
MNANVWLSPLVALIGVMLGGVLSSRVQARAWKQEEMRRWRESRMATYGDFVTAVRSFRTYVLRPDSLIEVIALNDGVRMTPGFEGEGTFQYQAVEATLARIKMVAQDQATVDTAVRHLRIARRFAVARAVYGLDQIPRDLNDLLFRTELGFVNAARTELGLPDVASLTYPDEVATTTRGEELRTLDRMLWEAHHNGIPPANEGRNKTRAGSKTVVVDAPKEGRTTK